MRRVLNRQNSPFSLQILVRPMTLWRRDRPECSAYRVSTLVRSPSATGIPYRRTVDGKTCRRTQTGRSGKERSRVCVAFVTVVSINRMTSWIVWEAVAGTVS